ncbi:MAG: hypothetical protein A2Y82_01640 [Candidatus Buchananbacteria bacterium RBG_13_36_9]|uniref:Uncharacterized protein n=1 Tax=Candidatus Buchananbacteria bacterium RBG_13_36_9 TaxID=1797530 RepID=A0A1G1XP19_9BACT|nr:MAG: hypothetical protein A2Y82_01640 [Candidatus Buchananbacteria bacterium RBG_13_36_9]
MPSFMAIFAGMLALVAIFLLSSCANPSKEIGIESRESQLSNSNQTKPKEVSNESLYSVVPTSLPKIRYEYGIEMSFNVTLKNLDIKPFITNLGTNNCFFTDLNGKKYIAAFTSGIPPLKKPLLPGEEVSVAINYGQLSVSFLQNGEVGCSLSANGDGNKQKDILTNAVKCVYDGSAKCICEDLGPMKVDSCTFLITTDGRMASPEGNYPLTVDMQKLN